MKIGIDYSLSSPGVCVNTSEGEFKTEDCTFYFLTNTKKYNTTFKSLTEPYGIWGEVKFIGSSHDEYTSEPERYNQIADWVVNIIKSYKTYNSNRRLLVWFHGKSISYRRKPRVIKV